MINSIDKTLCCGCKSCGLVCPRACISFKEDSIGAIYPVVNVDLCINCGKCERVCPLRQDFNNEIGMKAFVAYSSDKAVRERGSSGGMFETFASEILSKGGTVFASKFDEKLQLKCFEATTLLEVQEMTKSKYLQSDVSEMFSTIKKRILDNRKILFCGSPCQVSALKNYLGDIADNPNVLLVDFFCHGVPSQRFFDKCIDYVEKRDGINVLSYRFREKKKNGATPHYYSMIYEKDNKTYKKFDLYINDPYYLGFQKYLTLRDSCYLCPYGKGNHRGDITIGDFHEVNRYIQHINRFDGVSTVIINTLKGLDIWNQVSLKLETFHIDINQLHCDGQIYVGGTRKPASRENFINDVEIMPFGDVIDKWFNRKNERLKLLYYNLPSPIRKCAKKLLHM